MSHKTQNLPTIKEGAIFIADAHDNAHDRWLFGAFLRSVESGKLKPTQLFLMGDMFDLLVSGVDNSVKLNLAAVERLNKIAETTEIYYFEGNHDYNLQPLFPNIKVFPLSSQPVYFSAKDKVFALSHGDLYEPFGYKAYTAFIRNKAAVFVLNALDMAFGNFITKRILRAQENKKIYLKVENFEAKIVKKLENFKNCDFVVEGHYHQNKTFVIEDKTYINLASFAAEKLFYRFKDLTFEAVEFK